MRTATTNGLDWLSYEPLESCSGLAFSPQGPLPDAVSYWNYLSASYWVIDAFMMRDMAAATGRDAAKYQQMADSAKAYIKENFLNEDGTFKTAILNTMQTPALFALKNQLLEGEPKAKMIDRLRENFAQHDLCLQTGFLGTSILILPSRRMAWKTLPMNSSSNVRTQAGYTLWTMEPPPFGNGGTAI